MQVNSEYHEYSLRLNKAQKTFSGAGLVKSEVKKDGTIYLGVFGQTWKNPKYKQRYEDHLPITQEKGTFIVTQDGTPNTPELYRVHHYTEEELINLLEPRFCIQTFENTTFTSYHGNKANGFIITAKNQ